MDVFSLAIELGKAIQEDERYINFKIASQKNDEDKNLQDLINDFNLKKLSINNEITKDKKDGEKIRSNYVRKSLFFLARLRRNLWQCHAQLSF